MCVCVCVCACVCVCVCVCLCVCVSLPCCRLFIPIESSIELYTHNTPVCLSCIHMTHLYFLLRFVDTHLSFGFMHLRVLLYLNTMLCCVDALSDNNVLPSASDRCTTVFAALLRLLPVHDHTWVVHILCCSQDVARLRRPICDLDIGHFMIITTWQEECTIRTLGIQHYCSTLQNSPCNDMKLALYATAILLPPLCCMYNSTYIIQHIIYNYHYICQLAFSYSCSA